MNRIKAILFVSASIVLSLLLCGTFPSISSAAQKNKSVDYSDGYIRGYVESWLRHSRAVAPGQIEVKADDGTVTLTGTVESEQVGRAIAKEIESFDGVEDVVDLLVVNPKKYSRWSSWADWNEARPGKRWIGFPRGDVFLAPLADPKQPRFHTTMQRLRTGFGSFNFAAVGFGENFGLVRLRSRRHEGDGVQFGVSAAVFAIFNMHTYSKDLLNADYIVGFPLSVRRRGWSARARIFHQSSHLGDEFLLLPQPISVGPRINISYEELETLLSYDWKGLRAYGGPSRIVSSQTPLGRDRYQYGIEYRGAPAGWRRARFIAGAGVQSWEETGWDQDFSVKAGMMFTSPYKETRSFQVLLEYYEGHYPHGQFYQLDVRYLGAGIAFAY